MTTDDPTAPLTAPSATPSASPPVALPGLGEEPLPARRRVTCRMCGRPLRGREARLWGLGDECRAKLAVRGAPRPPAHDVEQDTLPGI
ncbi:DUF6011 domain-containing protein [Streptomyces sparsogenes]|uniref:DUF6011 domain-containing protein n=1 Tax=Streptomyces sparsogenes TaxID=67365 RepID=UPI0033D29D1D